MLKRIAFSFCFVLLTCALLGMSTLAGAATTERLTVSIDGAPVNAWSRWPGISDDGWFVSFQSSASNLVIDDTNASDDVFVIDRTKGITSRVSVSTAGVQADGPSSDPEISGNGRFVAFESSARNLIDGFPEAGTVNYQDVFLRDLVNNSTILISAPPSGGEADGSSQLRSISQDGSIVSFSSDATNLVATPNNGFSQAYIWSNGSIELVSVSPTGEAANGHCTYSSVSSDGRYVAFKSQATNLIDDPSIQYDIDVNGYVSPNIFIRDIHTNTTILVSVNPDGVSASNGNSSWVTRRWHGSILVFGSYATNLLAIPDTNGRGDLFAYDLATGKLERISDSYIPGVQGLNGNATHSTVISADNRYVCDWTRMNNLFANDNNETHDTVLWDFAMKKWESSSVASNGLQGDASSAFCAVNQDGKYVVFESDATNLVPGDVNLVQDIFLRIRDLDRDADGYDETTDCNESDPLINPGACDVKDDGLDQDCDGVDRTKGKPCSCIPDPNQVTVELSCSDGIDNDCDEQVDCGDGDCWKDDACICQPTSTDEVSLCNDGIDNDCDGLTDYEDVVDCPPPPCPSYTSKDACNGDPNCEWQGSPKNGQCVDSIPCTPTAPDEIGLCGDGIDNDCDGTADCDDADCGGDALCPTADCPLITVEADCKAEPDCRWSKKDQVCVNR